MATLGIPQNTIAVLQKYNFNFQKKYGQNFLVDPHVLEKIMDAAQITKEDCVVEIGPGIGTMTQYLAERAGEVVAVEIDKNLIPILEETLSEYDNVTVINDDILKVDLNSIVEEKNQGKPVKIVANLPYYITTPIINKLISDAIDVSYIVVMIQKEVALRFCAVPGTKDYNSLTVYLNYHFEVKKLFDVSKNSFVPKPKVDSTVICLKKRDKKQEVLDLALFYKLVRDSFCFKRKNLRNNLKGYDLSKLENVLKRYGYDLSVRAEQLNINIFVEMANELKN